jgi:hypothetical protein
MSGFSTVTSTFNPTMSVLQCLMLDVNTIVNSELSSSSGQTPVFPIYMRWNVPDTYVSGRYYQGSLREIKMIRNLPSGLTYRSASIDIGHIFGTRDSGSAVLGNSMILMA